MNKPIFLPKIVIQLDGKSVGDEYAIDLMSIRVQQCLSLPALCELIFSEGENKFGNLANLKVGTSILISIDGQNSVLFKGVMTAIEFSYNADRVNEVRLRGYDALHVLCKTRSLRTYIQVTPEELLNELLADVGLTVDASETGPLLQRVMQYNKSDMALIVSITRRYGLYFFLWDDQVKLITLAGTGDVISLAFGKELLDATVELNTLQSYSTVESAGWDPLTGELYQGFCRGSDIDKSDFPSDGGKYYLMGQNVQDTHQLDANAQAELDYRKATEFVLTGAAEGDSELRPGRSVNITGLANPLCRTYTLTSVTHKITRESGYISEISSMPPKINLHQYNNSLVTLIAIITRVDDPENIGRVQAIIPSLGKLETNWMEVICAGAGANKGLVILPDIDDQVILLFNHADPSQALVLGGIYGADGPLDNGVQGNQVERYTMRTPGGQQIQLNDDGEIVRIENNDGSYIQLSDTKTKIYSARDLDISAPGNQITIKAGKIDFERA